VPPKRYFLFLLPRTDGQIQSPPRVDKKGDGGEGGAGWSGGQRRRRGRSLLDGAGGGVLAVAGREWSEMWQASTHGPPPAGDGPEWAAGQEWSGWGGAADEAGRSSGRGWSWSKVRQQNPLPYLLSTSEHGAVLGVRWMRGPAGDVARASQSELGGMVALLKAPRVVR
jgi:hypothetical protein